MQFNKHMRKRHVATRVMMLVHNTYAANVNPINEI